MSPKAITPSFNPLNNAMNIDKPVEGTQYILCMLDNFQYIGVIREISFCMSLYTVSLGNREKSRKISNESTFPYYSFTVESGKPKNVSESKFNLNILDILGSFLHLQPFSIVKL